MDIEKIFNDLESNQLQECEEAKKKLVDLFIQKKEQWLVHNMMDYFLKTGSLRIIEVLVKVQSPHDVYIFDRLSEWLKNPQNRVQALNLFCFVVRKHPTWLFKVEKHRLFKDIFKLLGTEKEIVPLTCALFCIITLLPIIPNLVPNFLNDLFDIFGHLASWSCQNPNRLPDDKLVHLQLGLQMLFHRLYGMFPGNFLAYLSDFIKKEKGAIFHHTIRPLLETVRVHPMLITSTADSELSSARWKEMEPHDVVVECARLSLPVSHQIVYDLANGDQPYSNITSCDWLDTSKSMPGSSLNIKCHKLLNSSQHIKNSEKRLSRFDCGLSSSTKAIIWSPFNEINNSGAIPLTPTPSYVLQLSGSGANNINNQMLGLTGSSPPEAAVEATPETTPMKEIKEYKLQTVPLIGGQPSNPHAVRAILISSPPPSPIRKDCQFNFPEIVLSPSSTAFTTTTTTTTNVENQILKTVNRINTTVHDRMVQQMMADRNSFQNTFISQGLDGVFSKSDIDSVMPSFSNCSINKCSESDICLRNTSSTPNSILNNSSPNAGCDEFNETKRSMCTAGGLRIPTSQSMQLSGKGIRRSNRMTSYCCHEICSYDKIEPTSNPSMELIPRYLGKIRSKSCSSLCLISSKTDFRDIDLKKCKNNERRLQKSSKMLAIATARHNMKAGPQNVGMISRLTQTVQTWPQNCESTLFEMLVENNKIQRNYESNTVYPQDILDQYILRTIKSKENFDGGYRMDQDQIQLLCLQLQYERYRREIHAERNRRLMGRSRDKRSLEMERDRLREQLKNFAAKNKELMQQIDETTKMANEHQELYLTELVALKAKYQNELEQNKCLRQANENLQARLTEELVNRKETNYELESLRGQIFNLNTECQHAHLQAEMGLQCKQELAQLEAEFVIMGEVQMKCRDRLAEMDNYRARDEEMSMLQESYSNEIKEIKHMLEEKTSHLDSYRHRISELQAQLVNNEKVITEQKRMLKTVKDEYEEKFRALNRKYEVQKNIILQMEEKILSLHKTQAPVTITACSPDTEKTDVASSVERNSPLSTSLASSESLSASLRSTELRNLQQLVETPENANFSHPTNDERTSIAVSANMASALGKVNAKSGDSSAHTFEIPSTSTAVTSQTAKHPYLHLHKKTSPTSKREH